MRTIYLDMDGVIVNFVQACFEVFGIEDPGAWKTVDKWDGIPERVSWYLRDEVSDAKFWSSIEMKGHNFWAKAPWTPWGKSLIHLLEGYEVMLLTTPTLDPFCASGKMEWIVRNLPPVYHRNFALCPRKDLVAHSQAFLIDDNDHNIQSFTARGGLGYLVPMPWNSKRDEFYTASDPGQLVLTGITKALQEIE